MSIYKIQPVLLGNVRTYPLASRKSKVSVRDFAQPKLAGGKSPKISQLLDGLPRFLAANDLRSIINALHIARRKGNAIIWGIGGHVIKVGLGPVLIDLMKRGYISGLAMNGAGLVHDFEIAMVGNTSEDVAEELGTGQFGMASETGQYLNEMAKLATRVRIGFGEAAGQYLASGLLKVMFPESSVLLAAYKYRIPVTVHVAIGTDIPHMHKAANGAELGAASHYDFRLFCALVETMQPGGVYLNWGSAVVLPEVFLKAVSVVRNLGVPLRPITTANFDFTQHYRPLQNVVKRPTVAKKGDHGPESKGYAITGHHEVMMPLLAAALLSGWQDKKNKGPR